jgi:uncharacterized protein YeeX (DUF496 family)
LEQILDNTNIAIKNHNWDEAEILINQLVWKYENSLDSHSEKKKAWKKQQREIIKTIQEIQKRENPNAKNSILDKIKNVFD